MWHKADMTVGSLNARSRWSSGHRSLMTLRQLLTKADIGLIATPQCSSLSPLHLACGLILKGVARRHRPEKDAFQSEQPRRWPAISHHAPSFSRLFGVLAHPFAHEVDMISQHVEHARIGDRHSEVVCLLFQAVEPRDHLAHVAPAAAGVCHFVLQEPQLSYMRRTFDRIA